MNSVTALLTLHLKTVHHVLNPHTGTHIVWPSIPFMKEQNYGSKIEQGLIKETDDSVWAPQLKRKLAEASGQ